MATKALFQGKGSRPWSIMEARHTMAWPHQCRLLSSPEPVIRTGSSYLTPLVSLEHRGTNTGSSLFPPVGLEWGLIQYLEPPSKVKWLSTDVGFGEGNKVFTKTEVPKAAGP